MQAAETPQSVSLRDCFRECPDPRREHLRMHSLWDIVGLVLCASICGCDTVVEIEQYGLKKIDFLKTFLSLDHGIPSHDTIGRVFARLDLVQFRKGFAVWIQALAHAMKDRHIAIDGKTLRGSYDGDSKPLHLVSAFAVENRLVLSQQAVDEKSNEITAIPELIRLLDVKGAVITIDAIGCQKEIAAQIQAQKADYVLALKENHPTLHKEVSELFQEGLGSDFAGMRHQTKETEDQGHGRREVRNYYLIRPTKAWLSRHPEWSGLKTVGMVYSERQVGEQAPVGEVRYFISSLSLQIDRFADAVRNHWQIENNLNWVLDVGFREDESRLRMDHIAENMGWIRRLSVSLLSKSGVKVGTSAKRKMAGWDDEFLLEIAGHALS